MESFWNAQGKVDLIRITAQWLAVISTIIALIFTMRASTLNKQADAQKTQAASEERALLDTQIQTAKEEARHAKSESAETKANLQPRSLSKEQSQIIHDALVNAHPSKANPGKKSEVPIVIAAQMMNEESISYANQILAAIKNTGWEVGFTPSSLHTFDGIAIFYNPASRQSSVCKAVQDAFTKAGIPFSTGYLDINRIGLQVTETVYIVVGRK